MAFMGTKSASSSSSSTPSGFKYDVFLSFRGSDTCKNFTDHLYVALKQKGIYTFRNDEKLELGTFITPELLRAIEESRIGNIVHAIDLRELTWRGQFPFSVLLSSKTLTDFFTLCHCKHIHNQLCRDVANASRSSCP